MASDTGHGLHRRRVPTQLLVRRTVLGRIRSLPLRELSPLLLALSSGNLLRHVVALSLFLLGLILRTGRGSLPTQAGLLLAILGLRRLSLALVHVLCVVSRGARLDSPNAPEKHQAREKKKDMNSPR
jgi:hypothetical protein